jgi:hypothetical protein
MTWRCVTCDREFETLDGAVLLNQRGQNRVYKIDGEVHSLRRAMSAEQKHKTWHKKIPRPDCIYCFPPPPPPEPEPPVEVEEVASILESLPAPQPEPEIEDEDVESLTSMRMAFNRARK